VFVARAAARSARRIAADMTPSRAPPAVISASHRTLLVDLSFGAPKTESVSKKLGRCRFRFRPLPF
jgi:hypothetical protein